MSVPISQAIDAVTILNLLRNAGFLVSGTVCAWSIICRVDLLTADDIACLQPLPHDLEHVDQSVVCHLKTKILELLILLIKTQHRGAQTSLSTSKAKRLQVNLSQWIIHSNDNIYVLKISISDRF